MICDSCGEIIEVAILWTFDQEIDHFLGFDDSEMEVSLECLNSSYCMMKVLEPIYGAVEEYPEKTLLLAKKIIIIFNKNKGG